MEASLPIFLSRSLSRFTPRQFLSQQPMDLSDKSRSSVHPAPHPLPLLPPPPMILDPRFSSSSASSSSSAIDAGFRPMGGGVIVENRASHSTSDLEFTAATTPRPASAHSPASSTNSSSLSDDGGGGGGVAGPQTPTPTPTPTPTAGRTNQVGTVVLRGVPIVSLMIEEKERLCLAQISNTLLKNFSYNEIHNRRVALGITCVQCTPVQLEVLRRYGAMPISSRRCGMITRREAERLVTSFLEEHTPPKLPEAFAFSVAHACGWGCRGSFVPSRYNSSRAKCIKCHYCSMFLSPNKFIFHFHRTPDSKYHHPDAANFNSWRRHLVLDYAEPSEDLNHAWEDVKAMFNGGSRKRLPSPSKCGGGGGGGGGGGVGGVESRGGGDDDAKKRQCVGNKMASFAPSKTGPICLSYPRMLPLGTPPPPPPQQPPSAQIQVPYIPRQSPGNGSGCYPPLSMVALPQASYYDAMKMHMMEIWKARNSVTSSSSSSSSSSSFGMFWNKDIGFPGASVSLLYRNPMEPPPGVQQQRFVEAFLSSQGGVCPGSGGPFAAAAVDEGRFGAARFLEKPPLRRRMEEGPVSPSPHPPPVKRKAFSAFSRFDSAFDRMVASSPGSGFHHHHHHNHHQRAAGPPEVDQFDEPEVDSSSDGEKQEQELINVIDSPEDDNDNDDDDVRNCSKRAEANSDDERTIDKNGNNSFRQNLCEAETERELELNQSKDCISNRILASQDGGGGEVDIMRPTPLITDP